METYPLDIDPEQVVRWIMAETRAAPSSFRTVARRSVEARDIPVRREIHLGDEEREDLSEIATVATLEIAPTHASDGWLLTVVVEDEAGPRLPAKAAAIETDETIDLATFFDEFIRPGRGSASVVAEVADAAAEARMTPLLDSIQKNRHPPTRGRSPR